MRLFEKRMRRKHLKKIKKLHPEWFQNPLQLHAIQHVPTEYLSQITNIKIADSVATLEFDVESENEKDIVETADKMATQMSGHVRSATLGNRKIQGIHSLKNTPGEIQHLFFKIVQEYERSLIGWRYEKKYIGPYSIVFIIEDTFIFIIDLDKVLDLHSTSYNPSWDEELNYRITLEELTYNAFFKFSFSKFREETPGNYNLLKFIKFNDAKEGNNSKIDLVENKLPELQIRKRRESWEGVTTNFIVFEVIEFGLHGLAVFHTTSNNLNRDIRWVAKYIQDIGICNYKRITGLKGASCTAEYNHLKDLSDQMHKPLIKEGLICSGRYPSFDNSKEVTINDDMFEIMHRTILGLDSDSDIDCQDGVSLIMEGCLKCFTFKKGVRSSEGNARAINLDIIKAIQTGAYSECERFDYNTPTGRWKSEQEMYRCVERVFRGWTVEYQSHPWFLGRQSYDVYVHGKNLAFEYQGEQHFKPIDFFGGEEGYLQRVELDKRKRELSRKNGVHLIYVNYWENINDALIRQKISELGIEL